MKKNVTNVAASVHARLLNRAKADGRPFEELLQYYVMERFLYRLSRSDHADRFVLKGALMLQFWGGPLSRATKDIDLLGRSTATVDELVDVIRGCVAVPVDDDGLRFDAASMTGEEIRLAAHYQGVRIRCMAHLGNARVSLQVDIGFGDVVTPDVQEIEYPTLLESEAPHLLGYTPESVIAEKFEATFRRRQTALPETTPVALTPAFYSAEAKRAQWRAYLRKGRVQGSAPALEEVVPRIEAFVMPVVSAVVSGIPFERHWPPGGPWGEPTASW